VAGDKRGRWAWTRLLGRFSVVWTKARDREAARAALLADLDEWLADADLHIGEARR